EHALEQRLLVWCQDIALLAFLPGRELRVTEVVLDVAAASLNHDAGEQAPVRLVDRPGEVLRKVREVRVEQREQRAERVLLAAVRGRRHQEQVARGLGSQALDQ